MGDGTPTLTEAGGPPAPEAVWEGPGPGLRPPRPFSSRIGFCGAGGCFQNDARILLRSTSNQKRLLDGALV